MRAVVHGELWRGDTRIFAGPLDLQSSRRGWRVNVIASGMVDVRTLEKGTYELRLPSGNAASVQLDLIRPASREARFLGVGDPPREVAPLWWVQRAEGEDAVPSKPHKLQQ